MAELHPFRPFRPTPESCSRVASVPYDVCSTPEARALAEGNADSFLHVIRAEIGLPDEADNHSEEVYQLGRENLEALLERGALVQEEEPCLYLYRIVMGEHSQTGLVGTFSVEEYDDGRIVKHEHTRPDKEADRTQHVETLSAQTGPVFITYRPSAAVDALAAEQQTQEPLFDFVAPDGVKHTVWRLEETAAYVEAFAAIDLLYIADGHHRTASASNVRKKRAAKGELAADDPSHHFLGVAFPTDQVQILAYNRLINDLGQRSQAEFMAAIDGLSPTDDATPPDASSACLYAGEGWQLLRLEPLQDTPVSALAAQMIQDRVLAPLLDLTDQRRDERISFVGGIRGTDELARRVDAGEAKLALSLPPVTPEQLLNVADAGLTMPPKSTWFEPKLRSGLLIYPLR